MKETLEKLTVELSAKSGEGGRLFGSVTSKQITEQLQKDHNIKVDKRKQPALQDAASQARLYILMHECRPAVQASAYLL